MGIPNHNLDTLEQQRRMLEDNILQLQKSLYHWRTWEAEYDSLREGIRNLNDNATTEDFLSISREHGGTLVNEEEMQVILSSRQGITRSRGHVVDLLGRRIDYVKQNVATIEKKLRAAEDQLSALDSRVPIEKGQDFPMSEIVEELDEDGNVISSSVNMPGDQAPQLLEVLKKAGVEDIPDDAGKDKSDATGDTTTDMNTWVECEGNIGQDITPDSRKTAPETNGATEQDNMDIIRPVSLVTPEDRKEPPVTDVDESTENAKLRREMLQYGIHEVGAIVAELELDEDASDVSIDEEYDYDYDTDNDENEDEFGRSYPVLTEEYHQQMRDLEAKLNARGIWNMGKETQSLPAEVRQELENPPADTDQQPTDGVESPIKEKKPKKRVAFAEDLDIAPAPKPPAAEKIRPSQSNVQVLSDSIVERTERTQEPRATATDAPKKTSRFRSARSATSDDTTTGSIASTTSQFAQVRTTRKQTNTAPSATPPPLFPATPNEPKPFSTPITDNTETPSTPRPPEGKTLADKLIEREITPGAASAPEPDELDEEMHRREIASEFYKMRNRMIHQNGGFVDAEEQDVPIETDGPKRVSKFKAARMR